MLLMVTMLQRAAMQSNSVKIVQGVLGLAFLSAWGLVSWLFPCVYALPQGYHTGELRYTHVGLEPEEANRPRSEKLVRRLTPPDLQEAMTALVHDPQNIEKRMLVAYRYYEQRRWADAQREALKASMLYKQQYHGKPMHPLICLILGAVHRERGHFKEAELYLLDAIDQFPPDSPQYSEALYELGQTYVASHDTEKATVLLKRHVALSPHHAEGWAALAHAYQAEGEPMEALHCKEVALQYAPEDTALRQEVITIYQSHQAWSKVLDHAMLMHMHEPDNPMWLQMAQEAASKNGQYTLAASLGQKRLGVSGTLSRQEAETAVDDALKAVRTQQATTSHKATGMMVATVQSLPFHSLETILLILEQSPDPMGSLFPSGEQRDKVLRGMPHTSTDHILRMILLSWMHHHPEARIEAEAALDASRASDSMLVSVGDIFLCLGKKELLPAELAFMAYDAVLRGSPDTPLNTPERVAAYKGLTELAALLEDEQVLLHPKVSTLKQMLPQVKVKTTFAAGERPRRGDPLRPVSKAIFLSLNEHYHRKLSAYLARHHYPVPAWHQQLDTLYLNPVMHTKQRVKDYKKMQKLTYKIMAPPNQQMLRKKP